MTENERKTASEKYYQELREKLDERIRKDSQLNKISQKIRENAADFNDTAQYSELVSNHIAAVLQENVGEITSPLAKEYVCKELLKDQHSAINEVLGAVQVSIDEKNGIHIAPQKASFPLERVMKVAHALEDPTVSSETIKRRAGAPVANVSKSFHDDYMKENAKFRNDAGLKCYITRMGTSCCPWCSEVAGRFRFGDQPDDIFRRHDNCDCTIIYDNQVLRGQRSADGGRTKTWEQIGDVPTDYQPTVFTQEQAKALEQRNLSQFKGLTNGENSGIIETERQRSIDGMNAVEEKRTAAGNRKSPLYELTEQDIKFVSTEIEAIGADLNDFVFNSKAVRGTCFLASDGKVHIKGNIFPDENSKHPRDIMSVRAVLAHEYYGHRPYREQYIREDNDNSPDSINRIMSRAWADEFRASYMAAKNTPNLSDEDRYFLIRDSLSRAEEAGVSIKYNDFIRRVLYG